MVRFDPGGPPEARYPEPLETGRWPAVFHVSPYYPTVDAVLGGHVHSERRSSVRVRTAG